MPGIAGYIGDFSTIEARHLLERMNRALNFKGSNGEKSFMGCGFGLGWVGSTSRMANPTPTTNEDETVYVVMQGEIYNRAELRKMLEEMGCALKSDQDPELVLRLYQYMTDTFPSLLNGSFIISIWDDLEQKLSIISDRFGLYPLYYATINGSFLFASAIRALLAHRELPRRMDVVGLAQFLVFDHSFLDKTLLDEVKWLPPASRLTYANGGCQLETYWKPVYPDFYQPLSEQEYVDGFLHYLRQGVNRQSPDGMPAAVLLSGGLDSRMILACLHDLVGNERLHTFTFGARVCEDARYAKEVSRLLGLENHYFELKPDYLLNLVNDGVELTDGTSNIIHFHALVTQQPGAEQVPLIYKGLFGDTLMGMWSDRYHLANYTSEDTAFMKYAFYERDGVHIFNHMQLDDLLIDSFRKEVGRQVVETLDIAMNESGSQLIANQRHYFFMRYRFPRLSINGVELVRSKTQVRLPYCDNDLVDFALSIPPGLRYGRYITEKAFNQAYHNLAKIPHTETGLPLVPCFRDLFLRMNAQTRWRMRAAGFKRFPLVERRAYAKYDVWMRTVLREWVEGILLSDQFFSRGYFNPRYVRALVSEHMSGKDHHKKLGSLLALELWHRNFLD